MSLAAAIVFLAAAGSNGLAQDAGQQNMPPQTQPQYQQQGPPPQEQQPAYGQQQGYPSQPPAPTSAQDPNPPQDDQQQYAPQQPPLRPDQLEQLVAPVALYPDALLAQVLTAATYPQQVSMADQWLQQLGNASPDQVAAGADSQNWDPSVKGLTAFPPVLAMMDQNLEWTTQLGNAYFNQPQDVMQTVQMLRQRAEQAGTLQNSPQETVTQDQGAIQLSFSSPDSASVPDYYPWSAFGSAISQYPGFSLPSVLSSLLGNGSGGGPLQFLSGVAMNAFNGKPFGLSGWSMNWLGHSVYYHQSPYFTNSVTVADWGYPHGGRRAYSGWDRGGYRAREDRPAFGHAPIPSNRSGGYDRGDYNRPEPAARPAEEGGRPVTTQPARSYANGYGDSDDHGRDSQQDWNRAARQPSAPPSGDRGHLSAPGAAADAGQVYRDVRPDVAARAVVEGGGSAVSRGGDVAKGVAEGAPKAVFKGGKDLTKGIAHLGGHHDKQPHIKAPKEKKHHEKTHHEKSHHDKKHKDKEDKQR